MYDIVHLEILKTISFFEFSYQTLSKIFIFQLKETLFIIVRESVLRFNLRVSQGEKRESVVTLNFEQVELFVQRNS